MGTRFSSRERRGLIGVLTTVLLLTGLSFWMRSNRTIPDSAIPATEVREEGRTEETLDRVVVRDTSQNKNRQKNVNNKDKSKKRYNRKKGFSTEPPRDPFEKVPTAD